MGRTVSDLGKALKLKSPEYSDVPDADLGRALKLKHPGSYDDFVDDPVAASSEPASTAPGPIQSAPKPAPKIPKPQLPEGMSMERAKALGMDKTGLPGIPVPQPPQDIAPAYSGQPVYDWVSSGLNKLPAPIAVPAQRLMRGAGSTMAGTVAAAEPISEMASKVVNATLALPPAVRSSLAATPMGLGTLVWSQDPVRQVGQEAARHQKEIGAQEIDATKPYQKKTFKDNPELWKDPVYMSGVAAEGLGSLVAFLATAPGRAPSAAAKLPSVVEKLTKARPALEAAWRAMPATVVGSTMESLVNATDAYNTAKDIDPEKALATFGSALVRDFPLTLVTNALGVFTPKTGKWRASDIVMEGAQEGAQGEATARALKANLGDKAPPHEGLAEEVFGGSASAAITNIADAAVNRISGKRGAHARTSSSAQPMPAPQQTTPVLVPSIPDSAPVVYARKGELDQLGAGGTTTVYEEDFNDDHGDVVPVRFAPKKPLNVADRMSAMETLFPRMTQGNREEFSGWDEDSQLSFIAHAARERGYDSVHIEDADGSARTIVLSPAAVSSISATPPPLPTPQAPSIPSPIATQAATPPPIPPPITTAPVIAPPIPPPIAAAPVAPKGKRKGKAPVNPQSPEDEAKELARLRAENTRLWAEHNAQEAAARAAAEALEAEDATGVPSDAVAPEIQPITATPSLAPAVTPLPPELQSVVDAVPPEARRFAEKMVREEFDSRDESKAAFDDLSPEVQARVKEVFEAAAQAERDAAKARRRAIPAESPNVGNIEPAPQQSPLGTKFVEVSPSKLAFGKTAEEIALGKTPAPIATPKLPAELSRAKPRPSPISAQSSPQLQGKEGTPNESRQEARQAEVRQEETKVGEGVIPSEERLQSAPAQVEPLPPPIGVPLSRSSINDTRESGRQEPVRQGPANSEEVSRIGETARETKIRIPGTTESYPARYTLKELDEIAASHSGITFQPNPRYELQNERNYNDPANQERVIYDASEPVFDPGFLVNNLPSVTDGPPAIDPQGNVLGGNSRVMKLERVYSAGSGAARRYRESLAQQASIYGIDPNKVASMRRPVLVRQVDEDSLLGEGRQKLIRGTNKTGTAELTPAERSRADAGAMTASAIQYIQAVMDEAGQDSTLREVLGSSAGTEMVNKLVEEGVFTQQEKPKLLDGKTGAVTQFAKDRIEQMMLGRLFRNSEQYQRTPAGLRDRLTKVAGPLFKSGESGPWGLVPIVQEAIDLIEYAGAHGIKNLDDVVRQDALFGNDPKFSRKSVAMAKMLNGKIDPLRRAIASFSNESAEATNPNARMFGEPMNPDEAFEEFFNQPATTASRKSDVKPRESTIYGMGFMGGQVLNDYLVRGWDNLKNSVVGRKASRAMRKSGDTARKKLIDYADPLRVHEKRKMGEELPDEDSAYVAVRMNPGARGVIDAKQAEMERILKGMIRPTGMKNKARMKLGFKDGEERLAKVAQWLENEHLLEEYDQFQVYKQQQASQPPPPPGQAPAKKKKIPKEYTFPDGKTLADVRREQAEIEQFFGIKDMVKVRRGAQELYNWMNNNLKEYADSGMLSQDAYMAMKNKWKKWVPLRREHGESDEDFESLYAKPQGMMSVRQDRVLSRDIGGSKLPVKNVLEQILLDMRRAVLVGNHNRVKRKLLGLTLKYPAAFKDDMVLIGPSAEIPDGRAEFKLRENGQVMRFHIPEELASVYRGMQASELSLLTSFFGFSSKIFTGGIVLAPVFQLKNFIKDSKNLMNTYIGPNGEVYTPVDILAGVFYSMTRGVLPGSRKLHEDFLKSLGSVSSANVTMGTAERNSQALSDLAGTNRIGRKAWNAVKSLGGIIPALQWTGETAELSNRLRSFQKTRRALEKQAKEALAKNLPAMPEATRNYIAGWYARGERGASVDFNRHGEAFVNSRRYLSFLNANIQGRYTTWRVLRDEPFLKLLGRIMLMTVIPTLALYKWNIDNYDDEWDETAPLQKRDNHVVYTGNGRDVNGNATDYFRIPLSDTEKQIVGPLIATLDAVRGRNPGAIKRILAENVANFASPVDVLEPEGKETTAWTMMFRAAMGATPPLLKTGLSLWGNKDTFTERPVVGKELNPETSDPASQYRHDTPRAAVAIGKALGVSPLKVQYAARSLGGYAGESLITADPSPMLFRRPMARAKNSAQWTALNESQSERDTQANEAGRIANRILESHNPQRFPQGSQDRDNAIGAVLREVFDLEYKAEQAYNQAVKSGKNTKEALANLDIAKIASARAVRFSKTLGQGRDTAFDRALGNAPVPVRAHTIHSLMQSNVMTLGSDKAAAENDMLIDHLSASKVLTDDVAERILLIRQSEANRP